MGNAFSIVMRWFMTLSAQQWLYVFMGTVFFGWICMRGYGSRSEY